MLRNYLEQRHISLSSGRSSIGLEREYWNALEVLAYEDGWHDWRDFFYFVVLKDKPDDMPLASYVRKYITSVLFIEYDKGRAA
tara:strand:- start:585 stop:833 length:249 start_codon:yes stop_codon:yes gene_type:complete